MLKKLIEWEWLSEKLISPIIKHYRMDRDFSNEYYLFSTLEENLPEHYKQFCTKKDANIIICDYYLDKEECFGLCNFYKKHRFKFTLKRLLNRK